MKALLSIILSGSMLVLSLNTSAQTDTEKKSTDKSVKVISSKDKATIIEIFKTLNSNEYRMEFEKNEVYGAKELPDGWVNALRTGFLSDVISNTYLFQTYQPKMNFWFFINRNRSEGLEGVLGKANASRLQAIITKYKGVAASTE